MMRALGILMLSAAFGATGLLPADAQETKKSDKPEIKGGIEGKINHVDVDKETVTITVDGRERTFTITDETTIVGPRGGVVRRRLKDPRFHAGLEVIVVAEGKNAKELHLGYDRKDAEEAAGEAKAPAKPAPKPERPGEPAKKTEAKTPAKTAPRGEAAKKDEADEDEEFPGKVKSVDPTRRLLVITLLNGKDRSFLLSKEAKILVKGTPSKQGLQDPMLKAGVPITVITDEGGRKVKEVQVAPVPAKKKAG
jgi:hypothetical protein